MLTGATSSRNMMLTGATFMTAPSYHQTSVAENWDAIVIGSGIGGLTAAALLARHGGKRVLVLERHYTAGGFTHVFRRPGYEWDCGVHYVGECNGATAVRAALDHLTEGRLKWNPLPEVYDRIVIDGRAYDFCAGAGRLRAQMKSYFPGETAAIDQYFEAVESAAASVNLFFMEKALPAPLARLAGPLLRKKFLRWSDRTTGSVLNSLTTNRELIAVLTGQWGDYGLPPGESSFGVHALIVQHYFEGASYPAGGAARIAAEIAPSIERAGGRILVSAEVASILTDRDRATGVRMADGREFRAKIVVSDAGARNTYLRLIDPDLALNLGVTESLREIPPSMSHLCLYAGIKHDGVPPDTGATNLWIYPAPDHDANVARFAADPDAPFPALFISFPSAKDPTFATRYPNRSTIEVVAPAPYRWFEPYSDTRWKKRGLDYDHLKRTLTDRLRTELERYVPAVRGRLDYVELSTPLSTRHFANHPSGEIYGLSATPARFRSRLAAPRTPVKNLYLAGADACTLGVAGAMMGGVLAACAALGRNIMSTVTRPMAARAA
jgi:all-trans-retinol 13,14-reductase